MFGDTINACHVKSSLTNGIDGYVNRLGGQFCPRHMNRQFVNVSAYEAERKLQFLLQHFQAQIQIVEWSVSPP